MLHPDKTRNPIAAKLNPSTVISRGITPEKPTKASYIALVIRMKDHPDFRQLVPVDRIAQSPVEIRLAQGN